MSSTSSKASDMRWNVGHTELSACKQLLSQFETQLWETMAKTKEKSNIL